MNIGALNMLITFQKSVSITDKYGNHKNSWKDYFSCWATVGTGTGKEREGVIVNPEESMDFTTRYSSELTAVTSTGYRIKAGEHIYNITYVNPMGYKNRSLKFNCSLQKEKT